MHCQHLTRPTYQLVRRNQMHVQVISPICHFYIHPSLSVVPFYLISFCCRSAGQTNVPPISHSRNDPPNIVFITAIHHPPSGPPNSLLHVFIHPLHRADIALFLVSCSPFFSSSSSHSTPDPSSLPPDHRHFRRPRPAVSPEVEPGPGPQRGRRKGCRSEHGADRRHR